MSAVDLAPGTRVRHTVKGIMGTVDPGAVGYLVRREHPDLVPVQYDDDDAWLTSSSFLAVVEPEPAASAVTRCPRCGGTNGNHLLVHVRYGNGGGGNRPCPAASADVVEPEPGAGAVAAFNAGARRAWCVKCERGHDGDCTGPSASAEVVDVVPGVTRDPGFVSSARPSSSQAGLAAVRYRLGGPVAEPAVPADHRG